MTAESLNNQIKEKVPQIIELFVEVYGEEYRDRISSRLNNTVFVFEGLESGKKGENVYQINHDYQESAKEFLRESDIILGEETYEKGLRNGYAGGAFVSAKKSSPNEVSCVCLLSHYDRLNDAILFHELNHIVSSDIYQTESGFTTRSGLLRTSYIVDENGKATMRETERELEDLDRFEGLNEVFNDYLSLKVTALAESRGLKIGQAENVEAVYAAAFPMLSKFIDENQSLIVKAMLEGKKKDLISFVGKNNFPKLADVTYDLLAFESEHAEEVMKQMRYYKCDIDKLLTEKLENIPINLKSYANLGRSICKVVDEINSQNEDYLE